MKTNFTKEDFTKEDLRNGDKVITRDGRIWLVIKDCNTASYGRQSFILIGLANDSSFLTSNDYGDGLTCCGASCSDIMKVYCDGDECMSGLSIKNDVETYDLIWSRE